MHERQPLARGWRERGSDGTNDGMGQPSTSILRGAHGEAIIEQAGDRALTFGDIPGLPLVGTIVFDGACIGAVSQRASKEMEDDH